MLLVPFPNVALLRKRLQIDLSKIKIYAACVSLQKHLILYISNGHPLSYGELCYHSSGKEAVYSYPFTMKEIKC